MEQQRRIADRRAALSSAEHTVKPEPEGEGPTHSVHFEHQSTLGGLPGASTLPGPNSNSQGLPQGYMDEPDNTWMLEGIPDGSPSASPAALSPVSGQES